MIRPTAGSGKNNSPARDQRNLSFSDVGEDSLPNPLISDFRAPGKTRDKDIWHQQSPSGRALVAESTPAIRGSTDGGRSISAYPLARPADTSPQPPNRPKANTPPTPPAATSPAARPLYESTPHTAAQMYLAGRNPRDIPLAPRKSASLGPSAGREIFPSKAPGSDVKRPADLGSASVEVLRMFTEIEALEQRIRRSAEKDNENLKLITTIETEISGKDDYSLYMMPSTGGNESPQGSPRSPRSPGRSPQANPHINIYSKSMPSPPFSPPPADL